MKVDLKILLDEKIETNFYQVEPGDSETPAPISLADWKETLFAINVAHRLIQQMRRDIEPLESSQHVHNNHSSDCVCRACFS